MDKRQLVIIIIVVLLSLVFRILRKKISDNKKGEGINGGVRKKKGEDSNDDYEPYSGR